MARYAIMLFHPAVPRSPKNPSGWHYCCTRNGLLHRTAVELAKEFPHLVKTWKTKAGARAAIRRITERYSYTADDFIIITKKGDTS